MNHQKKLITLVFLSTLGLAQTTPNLGLNIPNTGTTNWGPLVNANFVKLDGVLPCFGTATVAGTITYFTGSKWVCLAGNTSAQPQVLQELAGSPSWTTIGAGTITGVTAGTGLTGGGSSGSVTLSVSVPNSSAAPGEPMVGLSSSAAGPKALWFETSGYGGTDVCQHIQSALSTIYGSGSVYNTAGIVLDARADIASLSAGLLPCTVMPFDFTPGVSVGSIDVLLPCGVIDKTNQGIVAVPGTPSDTANDQYIAGWTGSIRVHSGCGHSMGSLNTGNTEGTTIFADNSFPACIFGGSSGQPNQCTQNSTWQVDISAGFTDTYWSKKVDIYSSNSSVWKFSTAYKWANIIVNPASATQYLAGTITNIITTNTTNCPSGATNPCAELQYYQALGTPSASGPYNFIIQYPLSSEMAWFLTEKQGVGTYSVRFEDLTLDPNNIGGAIAAQDWYCGEKCGYSDDWLTNYADIGLDVEFGSSQASDYSRLVFTPAPNCNTNFGGNTAVMDAVFRSSGARRLENSTFVGSNNCVPEYGFDMGSTGFIANGFHMEHTAPSASATSGMLEIGANPSPPVWAAPPPSNIAGVVSDGANGTCFNSSCNDFLYIGNASTVRESWFRYNISATNMADSLIDVGNGNTASTANDPYGLLYFLDGAGLCGLTDANFADGFTCAINYYNGNVKMSGTLNLTGLFTGSNEALSGYIDMTEISTPTDPTAGKDRFYMSSATHLASCLTSGGANCLLPTLNLFQNGGGTTSGFTLAATNTAYFGMLTVSNPISFTKIGYFVQTGDATSGDHYDIGIYDCQGTTPVHDCSQAAVTATLVCDSGAISQTTGSVWVPTTCTQGGTITLQPGTYILAVAGGATVAKYAYTGLSQGIPFSTITLASSLTNGQLGGTATTPSAGLVSSGVGQITLVLH